ncbi:MAG: hypothetical protein ACFE8O_08975 [Candidatus Hermodarchaeota archaeon]
MFRKNLVKTLLLLALAVVPIIALINAQLLGVVWIPALGGVSYISAPYGPNENQTYSVIFHSVNFTFLASTYDYGLLTDMPHTAHFLITFSNGQEENLTLHYDGFIGTAVLFIRYHWNITNHVSPRAGVITGNSQVLFNGWQFLVIPGN